MQLKYSSQLAAHPLPLERTVRRMPLLASPLPVHNAPDAVEGEVEAVHAVGREAQLALAVGEQVHEVGLARRDRRAQLDEERREPDGRGLEVAVDRHARVRQLEERRHALRVALGVGGGGVGVLQVMAMEARQAGGEDGAAEEKEGECGDDPHHMTTWTVLCTPMRSYNGRARAHHRKFNPSPYKSTLISKARWL